MLARQRVECERFYSFLYISIDKRRSRRVGQPRGCTDKVPWMSRKAGGAATALVYM